MWKKHFKVIGIVPGRVKTRRYGILDFSHEDLDENILHSLVKENFPYLELTPAGNKHFNKKDPEDTETVPENTEKIIPSPPVKRKEGNS